MFCFHNSIPSCQMWKIHSWAGVIFSRQLFWVSTILCYLQNWTLGLKLSSQLPDVKNSFTNRDCFYETIIWVQKTLCYLQKWMFCPITLFQVVRFEKILHKQGLLVCRNCFEYQQSYVIFKIEHFMSYFCLSQDYLLYLYISQIFFTFQVLFLIALNENLELILLCRLRDFFKD